MTQHPLKVDDFVVDISAEMNGWPDQKGQIIKIDGSNILVRYESGNERWKKDINLRFIKSGK